MLITCIVGGIVVGVQYYIFLTFGYDVVNKMRIDVFRKIIRLPLSWIQDKDNNAEQLTLTLGTNMYKIKYTYRCNYCFCLLMEDGFDITGSHTLDRGG